MGYTVYNRPDAHRDIDAAVQWYEERQAGLGIGFLDELEVLLSYLEDNPFLFQAFNRDLRQAPLHRFPYVIIYRIEEPDTAVVLAVFHTDQDPGKKPM
jgi:plasmid stabilization system protein ParE